MAAIVITADTPGAFLTQSCTPASGANGVTVQLDVQIT
jgi:hypothetical protein